MKTAYLCPFCCGYLVFKNKDKLKKIYCPNCSMEMLNNFECCGAPVPVFSSYNIIDFKVCLFCGTPIKIDEEFYRYLLENQFGIFKNRSISLESELT